MPRPGPADSERVSVPHSAGDDEDERSLGHLLREARRREAAQVGFYRSLKRIAREEGSTREEVRLRELLADEEEQLSLLAARLRELGFEPGDIVIPERSSSFDGWQAEARAREAGEVAFYKAALVRDMDERTRTVLKEILETERSHRESVMASWRSG